MTGAYNAHRRGLKKRVSTLLIYLILIAGSLILLTPFIWMVTTAFKQPNEVHLVPIRWISKNPSWNGFRIAFVDFSFLHYLWNTVWLTTVNIVGYLLSCALVAYGFATQRWKHKNKLFLLVLGTMMLPKEVTFYPQFILFKFMGWYGSMLPLWVPAFFADAFQVFLMRQFFLGVSVELSEAAKIDGCSRFRVFWNIYLPLSKPVLATSAIYIFMYHWNDFFKPLVYITKEPYRTASLALAYFNQTNDVLSFLPAQMAASIVLALPCVLIYYFAQRYFIAGMVYKGVK